MNYSLKYSIWPAPSKTIEGLQAIANIAVGVSFTITAPIPRVSIFTDTQYSSVTVTKLDLGIKDRCVAIIPFNIVRYDGRNRYRTVYYDLPQQFI